MNDFHEGTFFLDSYDSYDTYPKQYPERLETLINELSLIGITREQVLHILNYQETAPHLTQKGLDISEYLIYILQSLQALNTSIVYDDSSLPPRKPYAILTAPVRDWLKDGSRWVKREDDPELQQYETRKDIIIGGNMQHISAACNLILSARCGDFS